MDENLVTTVRQNDEYVEYLAVNEDGTFAAYRRLPASIFDESESDPHRIIITALKESYARISARA